jgi:transposase
MPRALPVAIRQRIVERHYAGVSLPTIAREFGLSPWTVRTLWRRYRERGEAGLGPDYAACGRPGPRFPAPIYAHALAVRRAHPGWGAGLIRIELAEAFPGQPLPHEATLRHWFRDAGLGPPPRPPHSPDPPRAREPHARWQLDATEQIPLADGSRVSWLAASDEASGGMLGAVVFPLCQLDAGRAPGGADGAALLVRPVGPATADPAGQWPSLGRLE